MPAQIFVSIPDDEPLELSRAWVGAVDGRPEALAEIDGRICWIETKETLLEIGVATCIPVDGGTDAWPHSVHIGGEGQGDGRILWTATTDPRVVGAARRFLARCLDGTIEIGQSLL